MKLALKNYFGQEVTDFSCEKKALHGGTLGQVELLTGVATLLDGSEKPYRLVHKTQKKWARYYDADSWKREYDLYESMLGSFFEESLRWPKCYNRCIGEDEIQIYMEYIDGITGLDLSIEMLVLASKELGRFQGRIYQQSNQQIENVTNFSKLDFAKVSYLNYRNWPEVYDYVREKECPLPEYFCKMMIELDENSDELWSQIEKLPVVLCHRDFWNTNVFYQDGKIRLIDWDTTGWGYLGEDIASLIADEADVTQMVHYYSKCVPAYYQGFGETSNVTLPDRNLIWEMILFQFGYRLVEAFKFAEDKEEQDLQIEIMQQIYHMKSMQE